jgi:hypothetical protein
VDRRDKPAMTANRLLPFVALIFSIFDFHFTHRPGRKTAQNSWEHPPHRILSTGIYLYILIIYIAILKILTKNPDLLPT